jgi:hypothetical protein
MSCHANDPPSSTQKRLTIEDLPGPQADWSTISAFALTFDAYVVLGSFEACAEIANARNSETLTDLRTCLFFEQRRWRHFGEEPDSSSLEYIHGIVEKTRIKLGAGERN